MLDAVTAKYAGSGATLKQIKACGRRRPASVPRLQVDRGQARGRPAGDYVYVASPPVGKSGPPKSTKTFSLAPGGLRAQENRVLSSTDPEDKVHLFAKHVDVAEAELPKRLEKQKQTVIEVRERKYPQLVRDRIKTRQDELVELAAGEGSPPSRPRSPSGRRRSTRATA